MSDKNVNDTTELEKEVALENLLQEVTQQAEEIKDS